MNPISGKVNWAYHPYTHKLSSPFSFSTFFDHHQPSRFWQWHLHCCLKIIWATWYWDQAVLCIIATSLWPHYPIGLNWPSQWLVAVIASREKSVQKKVKFAWRVDQEMESTTNNAKGINGQQMWVGYIRNFLKVFMTSGQHRIQLSRRIFNNKCRYRIGASLQNQAIV